MSLLKNYIPLIITGFLFLIIGMIIENAFGIIYWNDVGSILYKYQVLLAGVFTSIAGVAVIIAAIIQQQSKLRLKEQDQVYLKEKMVKGLLAEFIMIHRDISEIESVEGVSQFIAHKSSFLSSPLIKETSIYDNYSRQLPLIGTELTINIRIIMSEYKILINATEKLENLESTNTEVVADYVKEFQDHLGFVIYELAKICEDTSSIQAYQSRNNAHKAKLAKEKKNLSNDD